MLARAGGAMAFAWFAPGAALAAAGGENRLILSLTSTETVLLAVFGGAMSFAILSAFWMIRERGRILGDNSELRLRLSDLRASNERLDALVNTADQLTVVWQGGDQRPVMLGKLSPISGVPAQRSDFLAFGRWLTTNSAIAVEKAVARLRQRAEPFDITLMSQKGGVFEAQGRTSGGHAFVRFVELTRDRAELPQIRAENQRLRAALDSLQALFELTSYPVWLRDATGALYWANQAYCQAVDCPDSESVIDRSLELLDSAQRRAVDKAQQRTKSFAGQLPAVIAGDRRMFDVAEYRDDRGGAGIAVDRSEAEEVRATLKQTMAAHAQTLDHLATAVAIFDTRQQLQFYNSSFQQLWQLSEAFLASKPTNAQILDAIRADNRLQEFPDWRKWREAQLEIYQALEAREEWWHLPGGQTLRVVANPHHQGGATWLFENVTEHLALQSNYNALMQIQGETLENLNEAVAVFGLDGRMRLSNPAFARLWRLDAEDGLIGRHIASFAESCRNQLADQEQWDMIAGAITGLDEMRGDMSGRLEKADGEVYDYSLVRLPEGQTMLVLFEMTAAVNIERALKERNEALEQSDLLKNRFIQHVSYELRAPLTSIAGFSELLAMPDIGKLNGKQREYVKHINQSADVLKAIIDDILDLATIDAGAMTLAFETVSIPEVLDACEVALADRIADHGLTIRRDLAATAEAIDADARRLKQILYNLLNNAAGFSPDGGTIGIETRQQGDMLEIAITDEGPGIAEADRDSIFERFERGAGNRRNGAGLGLSIVRSFVELHGGEVGVEAAGSRGARFVCRLPLRQGKSRKAA